jgi:hypothetical protein
VPDPSPPGSPLPRHWLVALLALTSLTPLPAERLVVGLGTADPSYAVARQTDGGKRRETYVFMPGSYLAGMTQDSSLEKMPFTKIAQTLAPDLGRQNYFPAASTLKADLLLVVHWGVTARIDTDVDNNLTNLNALNELSEQYTQSMQAEADAIAGGGTSPELMPVYLGMTSGERSNLEMQAAHETTTYRGNQASFASLGRDNAAILGVAQTLAAESNTIMFSERYRALYDMTKEERYFVVVMAYDMPVLLKTGKMRRLWTARASIRSAGVNFRQAVDRISEISGGFFGQKTDGVVLRKSGEREGRVELGELKIIGTVEGK